MQIHVPSNTTPDANTNASKHPNTNPSLTRLHRGASLRAVPSVHPSMKSTAAMHP